MSTGRGPFRRLTDSLGLTYRPGGQPASGTPRVSRYTRGNGLSSRLDQDIDNLMSRVDELERRLRSRDER